MNLRILAICLINTPLFLFLPYEHGAVNDGGVLSETAAALAPLDLADKLENLVGYTIVDSKTIKGWYDDTEREEGAFKGCRHGRVIVFTDNRILTCAQYGYQYAYRPTAVILAKSSDFKMVVGDEIYNMRR